MFTKKNIAQDWSEHKVAATPVADTPVFHLGIRRAVGYTRNMLSTLFSDPLVFVVYALALVVAISIHEFAHAWVADRLGDPTARAMGRLTVNPLAHLDPLGTLTLLLVGFGWGRPVPFDPYNLQNPKRDGALIALAGPASNLILAGALAGLVRLVPNPLLLAIATPILALNVMLAVFNFVPVYPLDGEKILLGLLPGNLAVEFTGIMQQYGTIILILLIFPFGGSSAIASLISPIISGILKLLL